MHFQALFHVKMKFWTDLPGTSPKKLLTSGAWYGQGNEFKVRFLIALKRFYSDFTKSVGFTDIA